jgi:hypothetical protein
MQVVLVRPIAGGRISVTLLQQDDGGWCFVSWRRGGQEGAPLPDPPAEALQARFALEDEAVAYFERLAADGK